MLPMLEHNPHNPTPLQGVSLYLNAPYHGVIPRILGGSIFLDWEECIAWEEIS